jgi:hypothetical protein
MDLRAMDLRAMDLRAMVLRELPLLLADFKTDLVLVREVARSRTTPN